MGQSEKNTDSPSPLTHRQMLELSMLIAGGPYAEKRELQRAHAAVSLIVNPPKRRNECRIPEHGEEIRHRRDRGFDFGM